MKGWLVCVKRPAERLYRAIQIHSRLEDAEVHLEMLAENTTLQAVLAQFEDVEIFCADDDEADDDDPWRTPPPDIYGGG